MNASAIKAVCNYLGVGTAFVTRYEEWAHVIFVVIKGVGPRFVSKKAIAHLAKIAQINERLSQWAQGRVTVEYCPTHGLFYANDSWSGPGCEVDLGQVIDRVMALPEQARGYASPVMEAMALR